MTLSWALKRIPDLTGREEDVGEEHFRKREQNSLSKYGGRRVHGMFRGYERPIGAGMWDILGGHWGRRVEIRPPRQVGPIT